MSDSRVAIVTGSADGIGKAIALRLAADGCNIVLNDLPHQIERLRSASQEIEAAGRRATLFIGNVTVEDDVRLLVEHAVSTFGSVDIMVANAGVFFAQPIVEMTADDFDKTTDVNLRGVFLSYKYAAIQMIKQGRGGRIIGASSVVGKRGQENSSSYAASKFGVRGLTQSAALEWGHHGITVNAYCPGVIWTPMVRGLITEEYTESMLENEWANKVAARRLGQPEEIANLVSFLSSKESSFITGQSVTIDGGYVFD